MSEMIKLIQARQKEKSNSKERPATYSKYNRSIDWEKQILNQN